MGWHADCVGVNDRCQIYAAGIIPLIYVPNPNGDGLRLLASQGEAPKHTVWCQNLVADPQIRGNQYYFRRRYNEDECADLERGTEASALARLL